MENEENDEKLDPRIQVCNVKYMSSLSVNELYFRLVYQISLIIAMSFVLFFYIACFILKIIVKNKQNVMYTFTLFC